MINNASIAAVDRAAVTDQFIRPLSDNYGFAKLPGTIRRALTGSGDGLPLDCLGPLDRQYRHVVTFFVDAFGWRFFERVMNDYPFLDRFVREGVVSKITSQFPSTTPAHVTAIHTGQPVGQSGIYEWFFYEPTIDEVICPLRFSIAGDQYPNTLVGKLDPAVIFPTRTFYEDLADAGIDSHVFQTADIAHSPASVMYAKGSTIRPFTTLPEALTNITDRLLTATSPTYTFLYWAAIDTICHRYGPGSPQLEGEIDSFLVTMERRFAELIGNLHDTLILVIADHGQVETDPATTIYLNQVLPAIVPLLKTTAAGRPIVPAGSPRDFFLSVKDDSIDDAERQLGTLLAGRADVRRTADLMTDNYFGTPSATLLRRIGNLVILPYAGEAVWWYEHNRHSQQFRGNHGGLTRAEMETIVLARAID